MWLEILIEDNVLDLESGDLLLMILILIMKSNS